MRRKWEKKFDRCEVKVVEFVDYAYRDVEEEIYAPTKELDDDAPSAGSVAILHCPRTDDERVSVESSQPRWTYGSALNDTRKLAAELLCQTCVYSDMDPVQVSIRRKELAEAEAARMSAFATLEAARQEVRALVEGPVEGAPKDIS